MAIVKYILRNLIYIEFNETFDSTINLKAKMKSGKISIRARAGGR